jgi:hypothetical protein
VLRVPSGLIVTYCIICRALELKEALNTYVAQLCILIDDLNKEVFNKDYLSLNKWKSLNIIKQ